MTWRAMFIELNGIPLRGEVDRCDTVRRRDVQDEVRAPRREPPGARSHW